MRQINWRRLHPDNSPACAPERFIETAGFDGAMSDFPGWAAARPVSGLRAVPMKALFTSFPAADYLASKRFYEDLVGLEVQREFAGSPHRFTNYDLGGMVLKVYEWTEKFYGSGHSGLFIETDDLDAVVARIRDHGGKTTDIVVHAWGGRCCSITDPFGNIFDLIDAAQKGDS